ncbi:MAG: DUF1499 domain-containing protein [Pirellulaceae bacterium]|nr:DUF1499 domain-containing protein [Pirellulaceae bacterium]
MSKSMSANHSNGSAASWRRFRIRLFFLPIIVLILLAGMSAMATRPKNLGLLNGRLHPLPPTPNAVSTDSVNELQEMAPIKFSCSPEEALELVIRVVERQPRMRIVEQQRDYVHFEARSLIFRFVDDVEFLVVPEERQIHFRSASRVGHSDLGVNRKRMEKLTALIERELAAFLR